MAVVAEPLAPAPRLVSVLLLCWNHAPYLEQCIAALAAQTDRNFETLFLDNGSGDGSFELAAALFDRHGLEAKMLRNTAPASVPANFNRLLAGATGELIAPLSTDDWYEAGYIAGVREAAVSHPDAGWFACRGWLFFDDSGELRPIDSRDEGSGWVLTQLLQGLNPFNFVGCCYRRTALEGAGAWDEAMLVEDRDLFVRLSQRFRVVIIPQPLVTYRRSSASASANPAFMVAGFRRFFDKHRALFGSTYRTQVARMLAMNGSLAVDRGEFALARSLLLEAVRRAPLLEPAWRGLFYLVRKRLRG